MKPRRRPNWATYHLPRKRKTICPDCGKTSCECGKPAEGFEFDPPPPDRIDRELARELGLDALEV